MVKSNRRKRTIRICSREWDLRTGRDSGGAHFSTYDKDGLGRITVGTRGQDNRYILEMIMHEVVEGILSYDHRRWSEKPNGDGTDGRILFCFDHTYLDEFCPKLLDALTSCGMVDPRKKVI